MAPPCFAQCRSCHAYVDGDWVLQSRPPPYLVRREAIHAIGIKRKLNVNHNYGLCDAVKPCHYSPTEKAPIKKGVPQGKVCDKARWDDFGPAPLNVTLRMPRPAPPRTTRRPQYEWVPRGCSLAHFDQRAACRLLAGKQVLLVGDSSVWQLFLSLVFQLGGELGIHGRWDNTASACGDSVRLNFVRNDLLLWSAAPSEADAIRQCAKTATTRSFVTRALVDADLLLLSTGLHTQQTLAGERPRLPEEDPGGLRGGFYAAALNHTLRQLVAGRALLGHPADSVVVFGTPIPVPGCSNHSVPFASDEEALAAISANASLTAWSYWWAMLPRANREARAVAAANDVGFLDIARLSARRPDATMAQYNLMEDCMHSCLPGPVDTWIQLWLNFHRARRHGTRVALQSARAAAAHGRQRRFFANTTRGWLETKPWLELEDPRVCGALGLDCAPCARSQPWWPFGACYDAFRRAVLRKHGRDGQQTWRRTQHECRAAARSGSPH